MGRPASTITTDALMMGIPETSVTFYHLAWLTAFVFTVIVKIIDSLDGETSHCAFF